MNEISIKVQNLSKQYRLGTVGTGTISHDLNRLWAKIRGKDDPYLMVGGVNDRATKSDSNLVWALKDINFEVKQGEVLGIIGNNGAGKSTLLKLLSRVTSPTVGEISMKGRVGSLLEVGTGFHPELTGRENVYINGAILGMRKWEIDKRFDEIVDFAGIGSYIDTPVKRYSSGMKVRLGFSVAAHLEPEILIVDEVLAVGDFAFQKKCLGKISEVSKQGKRTILFVSHNMASIKSLCSRCVLLENGSVKAVGDVDDIIEQYKANNEQSLKASHSPYPEGSSKDYSFDQIRAFQEGSQKDTASFEASKEIVLEFSVSIKAPRSGVYLNVICMDSMDNILFTTATEDYLETSKVFEDNKSKIVVSTAIPAGILKPGIYSISPGLSIRDGNVTSLDKHEKAIAFEVVDSLTYRGERSKYRAPALIGPNMPFKKSL